MLKPIKTTGNQNKTSGKTGSVTKWTGSKETVPSNVDLSTPQEKMLASVKGTTITIVDDEVTDNENTKVFRQIVQEKYGLKLKFISIKDGVAGQNQFAQMVAAGNPARRFQRRRGDVPALCLLQHRPAAGSLSGQIGSLLEGSGFERLLFQQ